MGTDRIRVVSYRNILRRAGSRCSSSGSVACQMCSLGRIYGCVHAACGRGASQRRGLRAQIEIGASAGLPADRWHARACAHGRLYAVSCCREGVTAGGGGLGLDPLAQLKPPHAETTISKTMICPQRRATAHCTGRGRTDGAPMCAPCGEHTISTTAMMRYSFAFFHHIRFLSCVLCFLNLTAACQHRRASDLTASVPGRQQRWLPADRIPFSD